MMFVDAIGVVAVVGITGVEPDDVAFDSVGNTVDIGADGVDSDAFAVVLESIVVIVSGMDVAPGVGVRASADADGV